MKGCDLSIIGLTKELKYDEITQFLMGCYVSSNEAIWRTLGFKIHDRFPAHLNAPGGTGNMK